MPSGEMQGKMWGARAQDWVNLGESTSADIYNAVLDKLKVGPDINLLDIGCGGGTFCRMALDKGATVTGFDASYALIEIAKKRMPGSLFETGDMEKLPFEDNSFDVITGLNSFQFAENKVNAFKESRRVAKKGAKIFTLVWGNPEDCESTPVMMAIGSFLPAAPPKTSAQPPMFQKGTLESLAEEAGLKPIDSGEIDSVWNFPDEETALKTCLSAGLSTIAINNAGEEAVRKALSEVLVISKKTDGSYKFKNKFRYVISVA